MAEPLCSNLYRTGLKIYFSILSKPADASKIDFPLRRLCKFTKQKCIGARFYVLNQSKVCWMGGGGLSRKFYETYSKCLVIVLTK